MLAWEHLLCLWVSNSLSWFSAYVLVSSALAYGNLDSFAYRSDSTCLFKDSNEDGRFSLLDPLDGMPFTNIEGQLRKSSEIIEPLPTFNFTRLEGDHSSFNARLNSSYVALFDSGHIGFVDRSSDGIHPITYAGGTFITSIFQISCNGTISIRLPNQLQYNFIYHEPSRTILGQPSGSQQSLDRRKNDPLHSFIQRTKKAVDEVLPDSWSPFSFLVGPLKVSDRDQIGFQPRCPLKPFGLESFVKPGARPASFNGCGAENGMKVPDYRFTECCDNHDLCYDDCSMTWSQCNDNFRKCMHRQCNEKEPTWTEWGCNNLADVYADFVGTRLGAWSFSNSNADRCTCGCPSGTTNCTDMCLRDCRERCDFVDCSVETNSGKISKGTSISKASTISLKTTSTSVPTSSTLSTTISISSSSLSSSTIASLANSKTTSKSLSTTTITPTGMVPDPPGAECQDGQISWWPFDFWSTTTCAERNATFRTPRETPANTGSFKSLWWPSTSWFTTTHSPPKNETVDMSSVLRSETVIWWWPFI